MPISVQYLREQDANLAAKNQAGYITDSEFNGNLRSAELTLYEYYFRIFEQSSQIVDALNPFIVETTIQLTNGIGDFPSDYRHRLEVGYTWMKNDCYSGAPKIDEIPVDYMQANEEREVLSSAIRKPSIEKKIIRHTFKNDKIYVYPKEVREINFKYLKEPVFGVYASTLVSNANGDFDQFDPANSIDPQWPVQETNNLLDLLTFYRGIELRSTALIEFARLKQKNALIN